MRILYHHRTRGQHVEGVHIRSIVNALRELGHEVTVLSFPGADPERETDAQATSGRNRGRLAGMIVRLPGVFFEFMEIGYNLVTLVRMHAALRHLRPQLVYERYSLFLWATVWLARRRGIPVILEINDTALMERVRPLRMKWLARRVEGWCFRHCSGLVFVSTHLKQQSEKAYGAIARSVVTPNAADLVHFDPDRFDAGRLRAERGLGERTVCGYIGGFAPWHKLDAFVDALAPRLQEAPQLVLVLVGDGPTLPGLRARVAERGLTDRVLLPGRVSHREIPAWIACMDYAVLPDANTYCSPMKLFEFMAMGVAMVAPDCPPIMEVVDDGRSGWLFPRGQLAACAQRVIELAARPDERRQVGRMARDYVVRERQWRNNAEQLLSLVPDGATP